jgi:hypothetical protein
MKSKDEVTKKTISLLNQIQKDKGVKGKFIRCDNAGENMALASTLINYRDVNIKFEYTTPDSPQQNGKIERKFATLHGKMRAMLNEAQFTWPLRRNMWAYAVLLVTNWIIFYYVLKWDLLHMSYFMGPNQYGLIIYTLLVKLLLSSIQQKCSPRSRIKVFLEYIGWTCR